MKKVLVSAALFSTTAIAVVWAQQVDFPPPGGTVALVCAFNNTTPTINDGKFGMVQCDNTGTLKSTGSNGGSGVASTVNVSASTPEGAVSDAAWSGSGNGTIISILKALYNQLVSILAAVQSAIPAGTARIGYITDDPCSNLAKNVSAISQPTSSRLFQASPANKNYICSIAIVPADAENVSLVEGTGALCATNISPIIGGTTPANGLNLVAGGGIAWGSGSGTVTKGYTAGQDLCLLQSGTGRVSGSLTWVYAP